MQRELMRQSCAVCGSHSPSWLPRLNSTQNHGFSTLRKPAYGDASLEKPCSLKAQASQAGGSAASATTGPISIYPDHEFIIHDSCLLLLQKTSHAKSFLRRLYEVLASLPYSHNYQTVDWGHDYGMNDVANECGYDPWLVHLSPDPEHPQRPYSTFDPLKSPQVDDLLYESDLTRRKEGAREAPLVGNQLAITEAKCTVNPSDCFLKLPIEMCSLITEYLPTADVANLRLVSRAFQSSFHHQSFWASRFHYFYERSWFFEAMEAKNRLDWRKLYLLTRYVSIDKHLKNRRRIWELVSIISGSLELRWHGPMHCAGIERKEHSLGAVIRCHEPSGYDSREGSSMYHLHKIPVPARIAQISVSFTKLGDAKYVTGFTIWQKEGPPCHLGYESRDQQHVSIDGLTGIMLSNGKQGIRAIRFLSNRKTAWLGQRGGSVASSQLASAQQVQVIEGGFDGCKMMSLAIAGTDT